jgi:hypothetical protein
MRRSTYFLQFQAREYRSEGVASVDWAPPMPASPSRRTTIAVEAAGGRLGERLVVSASGVDAGRLATGALVGYAYERGVSARTRVHCSAGNDIELRFEAVAGSFASASETLEVDLRGLERPTQILIDDSATQAWGYADGRLTVRLPRGRAARRLMVRAAVA